MKRASRFPTRQATDGIRCYRACASAQFNPRLNPVLIMLRPSGHAAQLRVRKATGSPTPLSACAPRLAPWEVRSKVSENGRFQPASAITQAWTCSRRGIVYDAHDMVLKGIGFESIEGFFLGLQRTSAANPHVSCFWGMGINRGSPLPRRCVDRLFSVMPVSLVQPRPRRGDR